MTRWHRDALEAPHTKREIDMIPQGHEKLAELHFLRELLHAHQIDAQWSQKRAQAIAAKIMKLRREMGI